jgi:hypothetical protein
MTENIIDEREGEIDFKKNENHTKILSLDINKNSLVTLSNVCNLF